MDRKSRKKLLENTKLASGYGGWIYCAHCNQNIGYLCYVTYDNFNFTIAVNTDLKKVYVSFLMM